MLSSQVAAQLVTSNACSVSANAVLTCSANIVADGCDVTFQCANYADVKPYSCGLTATASTIAEVTTKLLNAEDGAVDAMNSTLATAPGFVVGDVQTNITNYITSKCSTSINSVQSIVCPIFVSDCSDNNILAINKLDATASCGLSKASELIQASGLGTNLTDTKKASNAKSIIKFAAIGVVAGFVGALLIGLLLRRTARFHAMVQRNLWLQQRQMQMQGIVAPRFRR